MEFKASRSRRVPAPGETGGRRKDGPPPAVPASRDSVLALQRAIGNRAVTGLAGRGPSSDRRLMRDTGATAVVLQRAAAGKLVLAREPKRAEDAQRRDEVTRGDRVHDEAMEFLEGKMKALYSSLSSKERAKLRPSGGDDTIAIGMIVDVNDPKETPRLVYTTAGNRASEELQAATEKLGLTRWVVDPNIKEKPKKKRGKATGKQPAETKPPIVHGPNEGPPTLTGGLEHAEQLIVLGAENEEVSLRALVVSRALCHDCPFELSEHNQGRITISVVLDDAPDAPQLPNAREERYKRKQAVMPGRGSEHDPGDEDDAEASRRRAKKPGGGGRTPPGGDKPAGPTQPPAGGKTEPKTVGPQPEATHTPTPAKAPVEPAKAPVEPPKAADPEETSARKAREADTELAEFESSTSRMAFATDVLHLGLGLWQVVSLVEQFAAALEMATSIRTHGSPYWQAIEGAEAAVKNAKATADYYRNLDLRPAMPSRETDPLDWDSVYELNQKQIMFLQVEAHIYAARDSIYGAIDELRDRYQALQDGMEERERALAVPVSSAVHAEAILYADAGRRIHPLLEDAITAYTEARNYALAADRFAEAALKTLELRLRALGDQGIFYAIDTDDLRDAALVKFNQRHL